MSEITDTPACEKESCCNGSCHETLSEETLKAAADLKATPDTVSPEELEKLQNGAAYEVDAAIKALVRSVPLGRALTETIARAAGRPVSHADLQAALEKQTANASQILTGILGQIVANAVGGNVHIKFDRDGDKGRLVIDFDVPASVQTELPL